MNFKDMMKSDLLLVENALEEYLKVKDEMFPKLFEAMAYTTMAGGKRIRAFLTLTFARMTGGNVESALPFACALEMVHAYSLIHDDLPCMDDDDMRRGKPSNHKVFGEAEALLAGDALLTYAFELCGSNPHVSSQCARDAVVYLAQYAGACGMVGGQVLDLEGEKRKLTKEELHHVHDLKTSCLIQAAAVLGCCTSDKGQQFIEIAKNYGKNIGLSFQVKDDILDVTGDEAVLGKPIGSDEHNNKTTYFDFMTMDEVKSYAKELTDKACSGLDDSEYALVLKDLAYYLLERKN